MIWKNIEIFNAEELVPFEDGSVTWLRIPRKAYENLETSMGKSMAENNTGVELRFVLKGESVKIVMSSLHGEKSFNTFHVYRGGLQGTWEDHEIHCHVTPTPEEFEIKPSARSKDQKVVHEMLKLDWDAEVIRVIFDRGKIRLHDVIGDVEPPKASQTPKNTLLCYGSSITHGSNSIDASHSWPAMLAHNLNMDCRNLGFAGSCALEPEVVEYIAAMGEQGKWQVANLELGINVLEWEEEKIYSRLENILDQVAGRNRDKHVFVISPFFYFDEVYKNCTGGAKWRRIIEEVINRRKDPNVTYINGLDILGDVSGMSGDLIHPSIYGVQQIADRLTEVYKKTLGV